MVAPGPASSTAPGTERRAAPAAGLSRDHRRLLARSRRGGILSVFAIRRAVCSSASAVPALEGPFYRTTVCWRGCLRVVDRSTIHSARAADGGSTTTRILSGLTEPQPARAVIRVSPTRPCRPALLTSSGWQACRRRFCRRTAQRREPPGDALSIAPRHPTLPANRAVLPTPGCETSVTRGARSRSPRSHRTSGRPVVSAEGAALPRDCFVSPGLFGASRRAGCVWSRITAVAVRAGVTFVASDLTAFLRSRIASTVFPSRSRRIVGQRHSGPQRRPVSHADPATAGSASHDRRLPDARVRARARRGTSPRDCARSVRMTPCASA